MKKELQLLLASLLISLSGHTLAQTVTYDLRCSSDGSSYELYITRNTTPVAPLTTVGSSRVTLVLPTGSSRTVAHTSEGNVPYGALPSIIDPGGVGSDYYGFSTSGGPSLIGQLTADVPALWMTFTPSDGTDQDARLFVNGTDPGLTAPGMGGVDLTNTFFVLTMAGSNDEYSSNVSTTVSCNALTAPDVALETVTLYPNPTKGTFRVDGLKGKSDIELYDLHGRLVARKEAYEANTDMDISHLESAVYFVRLYGDDGQRTVRLVKD